MTPPALLATPLVAWITMNSLTDACKIKFTSIFVHWFGSLYVNLVSLLPWDGTSYNTQRRIQEIDMDELTMDELTIENCEADDIIDALGEGLDLMWNSSTRKWRALLSGRAYDIVKRDPSGYLYTEGGQEFVIVYDNDAFRIHMRAVIDDSILQTKSHFLGCRRELDED